jgi:Domain of unknown function (DUF5011)
MAKGRGASRRGLISSGGGHQIHVFVGQAPMDQAVIDTSEPATYHINYVATDAAGNAATSTRTVMIEFPSIIPSYITAETPLLVETEPPAPATGDGNCRHPFRGSIAPGGVARPRGSIAVKSPMSFLGP